jgi:hypothetical protein
MIMKANDARIGNYVRYEGNIRTIEGILSKELATLNNGEVAIFDDLRPVRMNFGAIKEILTANDIKYRVYKDKLTFRFAGNTYQIKYKTDIKYVKLCEQNVQIIQKKGHYFGLLLAYVHEFQNYYHAITKQDIIIKTDLL